MKKTSTYDDELMEALKNPEEAAKIGLNGQSKCREYFDPSANGRKLLELLQRI